MEDKQQKELKQTKANRPYSRGKKAHKFHQATIFSLFGFLITVLVEIPSQDRALNLKNTKIRIRDLVDHFEIDQTPRNWVEPLLAIKDENNYFIAGDMFIDFQDETRTKRFVYKLIKDRKVLFFHIFADYEYPEGVVYVEALNSYFFLLDYHIYRRDISENPHQVYIPHKFELDMKINCHPSLPGRVLLFDHQRIVIWNLLFKKIELDCRSGKWSDYKDSSNFGSSQDSVAILYGLHDLDILSFHQRRETHKKAVRSDLNFSLVLGRVCGSDDQRVVCVSVEKRHQRDDNRVLFYEILEGSLDLRATFEAGAKVSEICFLNKFKDDYVFVAFIGSLKAAHLLVFDSRQGVLKETTDMGVNLGCTFPIAVRRVGSDVFFVGKELKLSKLSIIQT